MAAGSTYTPIATSTLGSAAADVTFSSIPGTYTDLILVTQVDAQTVEGVIKIVINADTAANYSITNLYGDGSAAGSARATSLTGLYAAWYVDPNTSLEHMTVSHFMNYSNTTTFKTMLSRANRASASNFPGAEAIVGLWRSTSAITSLKITGGGNLQAGSTFTLYGIAAA
jgi:hypothetical protein